MKQIFKSNYRHIFISGLIVYLITAIFSVGYFHADEHFQILEFCNYMLGNSSASDLPWEFHEEIRPAIQPVIAFVIIKGLNLINIFNPFVYTFILRVITAILSWFLVSKICLLFLDNFSTELGRKIYLFLSFFLWFIPFLSVRFSSENYSGLLFLWVIYIIIRYNNLNPNKKLLQFASAGILLGFSIFFRFQIVFSIAGLLLWIIFIQKTHLKNLLVLLIFACLSVAICIYIDSSFYNKPTITPINYFFANIIHNKAAGWGTYPWWSYFTFFILEAIPPISVFLLIFFVLGLSKLKSNIFTWCIIPFLIAHFMVGHKELRFLFPIISGFIFITSIAIDNFIYSKKYQKTGRIIWIICLSINIPIVIFKMFAPSQAAIKYYNFLYNYASKQEVVLLCKEESAYNLVNVKVNFYNSPNIKCVVLKDDIEISEYLKNNKPDSILLLERQLLANNKYEGYTSKNIYCSYPSWICKFNINNWESRARIWKIESLKKP